jgi:hypothetical protein
MNKKIRLIIFNIFMMLATTGYAQEFYVDNNSDIKALASKKEITRIAFDAAVTEVHAISEEIEYVINGKDIYLRMLLEEKPVNFFVKTEDDNTYKILLVGNDIPADQIFIHNKSAKLKNSSKTEYFSDFSQDLKARIAKIIDVSLNPIRYLGYSIEKKNTNLFTQLKSINMKLESLISGNQLIAEKIKVTNNGNIPIILNLADFAKPKYLAVYVNKAELLPNEDANLIRIIEN